MIYALLHPKKGTLYHMRTLLMLLAEVTTIVSVFTWLIDHSIRPLHASEIAYMLIFCTFTYSVIAIVASLDIMGFTRAESEEDTMYHDTQGREIEDAEMDTMQRLQRESEPTRATSFNACQRTVENGYRLTRRQGIALIDYAQAQEARANRQQTRADNLQIEVDANNEFSTRLVTQWNELCTVLDELFQVRIYSTELSREPSTHMLWTCEYQDKKSKGHETIADAYRYALTTWILPTQEKGIA